MLLIIKKKASPKKAEILDIAMNLSRVGNWAADGYAARRKRIIQFLDQTTGKVDSLDPASFSAPFKKTFDRFLKEYRKLEREGREGPADELYWAEAMMTWGNILTHRSSQLSA